jgi:multiple sugar transport system substrate-binding protein
MYITQKALAANKLGTSVKAVSIPSEDPSVSTNVLGTNGISVPKSCNNQATAASFINFFTNDKNAALAFQSDNGIVTNTASQQALLADPQTPAGVKQNVTIFRDLNARKDLTTSAYPDGYNTLYQEMNRLYQQVAFGQMTPQAAADAFFDKASQALR